jgi:osmoprotectant transport system substrate-binding protein
MHRPTASLSLVCWSIVCALVLAACSAPGDPAGTDDPAGTADPTGTDEPGGVDAGGDGGDDPLEPVRVASGPDPETVLLAGTMAAMLELQGLPAEVVPFSDARDARRALELGEVDVRPGYTGETWLETLGRPDPPSDPGQSYVAVRDHDVSAGIIWLRPRLGDGIDQPPANATFAFVVRGPPSVDADIRTMSQLASRLSEQPDALVCVDQEFGNRPDGLPAVLTAYSVRSDRSFLAADPGEAVLGVAAGDCLAGLTTATDGAAWRAGLRPLVDDLRVFPAFVPLPQIRVDAVTAQPLIRVALGPMSAELTTGSLGRWNARVASGEPVEQVAADAAQTLFQRAGRDLPAAPAS